MTVNEHVVNAFEEMISMVQKRTNFRNGDIVNINIAASNYRFITPISTGNMTSNVNGQALLDRIASILTSDETVDNNET